MQELWTSLGPEGQAAICGALSGIVLWALQRAYTVSKLPGLNPASTNCRKRVASVVAACVPAAVLASQTRDWRPVLTVGVVAWVVGQGAHRASKRRSE